MAAALAIEAGGTGLVAFGSIPAGLARQAAALGYSAWLLALALAAPREGSGNQAGPGPAYPPTPRLH